METGVLVAVIAASASILGGIVSGAFSLLLNHAKHKDEKADERTEWEKHVDECLDHDKRAINRLEKSAEDNKAMDKLMLRGLMLLTRHAVDHNGNNDLEAYADEVNNVLIQRL